MSVPQVIYLVRGQNAGLVAVTSKFHWAWAEARRHWDETNDEGDIWALIADEPLPEPDTRLWVVVLNMSDGYVCTDGTAESVRWTDAAPTRGAFRLDGLDMILGWSIKDRRSALEEAELFRRSLLRAENQQPSA